MSSQVWVPPRGLRVVDCLDLLVQLGDDLARSGRMQLLDGPALEAAVDAVGSDAAARVSHGLFSAAGVSAVRTFEDLTTWLGLVADPVCDATAGAVGFVSDRASRTTWRGLRLTDVLLTVGADHRAGRVLLPVADLERFECPVDDLGAALASPALRRVVALNAARAGSMLDAGIGVGACAPTEAIPLVSSMVGAARARLSALARARWDPLARPVRARPVHSLLLARRTRVAITLARRRQLNAAVGWP